MANGDLDDGLRRSLVGAWHQYLIALDPIRPDLFRYCRRLTGNVWDAEDLVQETLLKAFAKLSQLLYTVRNPRAYVLRIATHLWFDGLRRRATEHALLATGAGDAASGRGAAAPSESSELRDAAAALLQRLAPQERAAFLLVEVFELRLDEAAEILGTSVGAAKSALHRGRARIAETDPPPARRPKPSPELLDRFVERYNARDLPGMLALMANDAEIDMHSAHAEIGREGFERERGWFHHNFFSPIDGSASNARWQLASHAGEPVVLVFGGLADPGTLTSLMRIEEAEGRVRRIHVYALCPDVVREVGEHLGHPTRSFGYRFPFDLSKEA